jgi:rubrerythrin
MPGILGRWILSSVLRSALTFETEAIDAYREIREKLLAGGRGSCDESFEAGVCHLLEEEEAHRRLLGEAAAGRLASDELERTLADHMYAGFDAIRPLTGEELARWEPDLSAALDQEEKTWIFYGNLRRASRIPVVRRAFEVLARMEKEHVDILRKLLGRAPA